MRIQLLSIIGDIIHIQVLNNVALHLGNKNETIFFYQHVLRISLCLLVSFYEILIIYGSSLAHAVRFRLLVLDSTCSFWLCDVSYVSLAYDNMTFRMVLIYAMHVSAS